MDECGFQAPVVCRGLIRAGSWLVPTDRRKDWLARQTGDITGWWTLHERGELPGSASADLVARCWSAIAKGAGSRLNWYEFHRSLASPLFVLAGFLLAVILIAQWRGGFPGITTLLEACRNVHLDLPAALVRPSHLAARGVVLSYALPAFFGLIAGLAVIAAGPKPRRGRDWRYWPFLVTKLACVLLVVPLVWIEAAEAVRPWTPHSEGQRILLALIIRLLLIASLAWALGWAVADQRQRCPVCLRRLTLPATIGSWGSVFEPPVTEFLCETGHGSLCVPEAANGEPDRWIEFDSSWQELFQVK